jgi:hypothetical protein
METGNQTGVAELDTSSIDIAAIEAQIEKSLNLDKDNEFARAFTLFKELRTKRDILKGDHTRSEELDAKKQGLSKQKKDALTAFLKLSRKYEKDANDFLFWAARNNKDIRQTLARYKPVRRNMLILCICILMTCQTTSDEALNYSELGASKKNKILVKKIKDLLEAWYETYIETGIIQSVDSSSVAEHPCPSDVPAPSSNEVPTNTLETLEVPQSEDSNCVSCRFCGGDHWTLSCPKKTKNVDPVYNTPAFNQKKLPSLKQAMADVEAATGILYSAKYILERVISQQEESLKVAKQMIQSLE